MRDFQRSKVYAAEQTVRNMIDVADQSGHRTVEVFGSQVEIPVEYKFRDSLSDVQAYADRVLAAVGCSRPVSVQRGPGAQQKATYCAGVITLPQRDVESWAWREIVVLHEIAHHLTPGDSHGSEFTAAFLMLVEEMLGAEAAWLLRVEFGVAGVKTAVSA